ncbi:Hypothetical protein UVM_LOCUS182 [uncultured virus]|nr:Hypothetical protein UVM_LOCUS182 [uncultured virus]
MPRVMQSARGADAAVVVVTYGDSITIHGQQGEIFISCSRENFSPYVGWSGAAQWRDSRGPGPLQDVVRFRVVSTVARTPAESVRYGELVFLYGVACDGTERTLYINAEGCNLNIELKPGTQTDIGAIWQIDAPDASLLGRDVPYGAPIYLRSGLWNSRGVSTSLRTGNACSGLMSTNATISPTALPLMLVDFRDGDGKVPSVAGIISCCKDLGDPTACGNFWGGKRTGLCDPIMADYCATREGQDDPACVCLSAPVPGCLWLPCVNSATAYRSTKTECPKVDCLQYISLSGDVKDNIVKDVRQQCGTIIPDTSKVWLYVLLALGAVLLLGALAFLLLRPRRPPAAAVTVNAPQRLA